MIISVVAAAAVMVGLVMGNCPDLSWGKCGEPHLTPVKFPSASLADASAYCENCGMQLCTLDQMQEAYIDGFRSEQWALFARQGYDVRPSVCNSNYVSRKECYVMLNSPGKPASGFIPSTPRPAKTQSAWCCGK